MVMNGSTNQLLQAVDQHRKAYQLVLRLHGYQLQTNSEDRLCLTPECTQNESTRVNTKWENPPLERVMEKRNREHAKKTEEFVSIFSDLDRKKSDHRKGKRKSPYKSRFPSLTQPTSPSERSSVLAEHGSRNASSLSENSALLKPRLLSQNDATISDIVASIRNNMPATIARVNRLRQEFEREELRRTRLYRGECGPQSYERWQMNDYFVVRPIVEELVERVLSIIFKSRSLPALDAYSHSSRAFAQIQSNSRLLQLIVEELILEETHSLSVDISSETYQMQRFLADRIGSGFLQIIQKASCGDCEMTCAACDRHAKSLPEKFHDLQSNRMKNRRGVWHQSQCVQLDPWKKERDDSVPSVNGEAVLSFDHLISYDLIKTKSFAGRSDAESVWRQNSDACRQNEAKYWSLMMPSGFTLPITDNCSGISVVKASFNRRYVAVGTVRGNIFVIDFNWTPPKPVRLGIGVKDDAIVDIAWSIDSSKLISNTDKGVVCVWSLLFEKNSKNTIASAKESEDRAMPEKFFPIFKLEAAVQDFKFYTGPLAERSLHNNPTKPLLTAFHSSMTLCGSQPSLCLVLDSNDVIRCDISEQLRCSDETENGDDAELDHRSPVVYHPQVFPFSGRMNVIGSDVKAEIFRQHRHSIMFLGFVGNCRDMVTMDTGGYINRWKYAREFLSREEVFVPFKRYRLSLHQTQYIPLGERKVIFSDEDDADRRPRSEAEIKQERDRVETVISSAMNQLHLWHFQSSNDQRSPMNSFIYKPSEGVGASGATFHAIIRHRGNRLLSSYFTQQFFPVQNKAGRIVVCRMSPSGKEMVIVLIFPELKPKEAHLAILVLDVCEMRLKNFRKEVVLPDDTLYQRCLEESLVSCDITDPIGITSSQYVIVIVNGRLSGYSVATGQMVLTSAAKTDSGFIGCHLNAKKFSISENSRLAVTSAHGSLFLTLFEPRRKDSENPLFILRLKDKNSDLTRKQLRNSIIQWHGDAVVPPSEQRIDLVRWTTGPLHSQHHIKVMVREMLESVVDSVFDKVHGVSVPTENTAENAERRSKLYADLGREVGFLRKEYAENRIAKQF